MAERKRTMEKSIRTNYVREMPHLCRIAHDETGTKLYEKSKIC